MGGGRTMTGPKIVLYAAIAMALCSPLARAQDVKAIPAVSSYDTLSASRIDQIAAWLPSAPAGIGPRCADRATWNDPAVVRRLGQTFIAAAEKVAATPMPAWNDDDYLDFSRTGRRERGQAMMEARRERLDSLVIAECQEYRGRFLPAINATLAGLAEQHSWVIPAHDDDLRNFNGDYSVDLGSGGVGSEIAQTLYMLGDKLDPKTAAVARRELDKRVFQPVLASVRGPMGRHVWLKRHDNWNAVCTANVVGAALAVIPDARERALFVAIAENSSRYYRMGFNPDGYAVEGVGYWNYGFAYYERLREDVHRATSGKLDLFDDPIVEPFAHFGHKFEMSPGNYAMFGDVDFGPKSFKQTRAYANQVFGFGTTETLQNVGLSPNASILYSLHALFGQAPPVGGQRQPLEPDRLHSYFPDAGVLVSRAGPGELLAITIKSGGNSLGHAHDDIGSYSLAVGDEQPTGDLGKPVYDATTFTSKRRTIKLMNSYGHPVPRVAGQLQIDGGKAAPRVVSKTLTDAKDTMVIDMRPAYDVPTLTALSRTMTHKRGKAESVATRDDFAFAQPDTFETALVTGGEAKIVDTRTIEFRRGKRRVRASVQASSAFTLTPETITDAGVTFTRIGVQLRGKQQRGHITIIFTNVR